MLLLNPLYFHAVSLRTSVHRRRLGPDPQPRGAEAGLELITAYEEDRSNGGFQVASARARRICHNPGKLQVVNGCSHSPEEERSRQM